MQWNDGMSPYLQCTTAYDLTRKRFSLQGVRNATWIGCDVGLSQERRGWPGCVCVSVDDGWRTPYGEMWHGGSFEKEKKKKKNKAPKKRKARGKKKSKKPTVRIISHLSEWTRLLTTIASPSTTYDHERPRRSWVECTRVDIRTLYIPPSPADHPGFPKAVNSQMHGVLYKLSVSTPIKSMPARA